LSGYREPELEFGFVLFVDAISAIVRAGGMRCKLAWTCENSAD
jgi:hypothetical protein